MKTGISNKDLAQIREQMLKFATLQVGDSVLAEDLVQESFLSAFNHLEQFKRQAAFKTWVFAILKNKIIDFLRQKGKLVLETEIEDEEQTNHFFDEGGHWKAEHSPLDLELSESAVYSEEFWLNLPTRQTSQDFYDERVFGIIFRRNLPRKSTKHK